MYVCVCVCLWMCHNKLYYTPSRYYRLVFAIYLNDARVLSFYVQTALYDKLSLDYSVQYRKNKLAKFQRYGFHDGDNGRLN